MNQYTGRHREMGRTAAKDLPFLYGETDDGKSDEKAETNQSGSVHDVFQINDHWMENKPLFGVP